MLNRKMEVTIEIDGVKHRMVESGMLTYCEGDQGGAGACSLRHICQGAHPTTAQEAVMKFCLMFPHEGCVRFVNG